MNTQPPAPTPDNTQPPLAQELGNTSSSSPTSDRIQVRRALISVNDKTGVVEFARALVESGCSIISSGGTAAELQESGISCTEVSDITGFPEMLDGRVKTLHPKVHAGILADRSKPDHISTLQEHAIEPIDLVVVNLYPFDQSVSDETSDAEGVKLIDVGGPTMVRGAAKNFASVCVVVDSGDYDKIVAEVEAGGTTLQTRRLMAGKAFARLSMYDAAIAKWFDDDELPRKLAVVATRREVLRYGENPHQQGAIYRLGSQDHGIAAAKQLQGKEMSYVNWLDADAVLRLASAFDQPCAVIVKHTNPCGVAVSNTIEEAWQLAFACDPRSAFGGIVGLNRPCTEVVAKSMQHEWTSSQFFLECIVAPAFDPAALEIFATKKNIRLLQLGGNEAYADGLTLTSISGGLLAQTSDPLRERRADMRVVSAREPSDAEWEDLLFAWTVCAHVKSNAIVLANLKQAVGVGAGQMSRVESMEIAINRAGDRAKGSTAASEALLPFADSIETAAAAGITAIIQPGGSIRDSEVINAADSVEMAMVFTDTRHFLH